MQIDVRQSKAIIGNVQGENERLTALVQDLKEVIPLLFVLYMYYHTRPAKKLIPGQIQVPTLLLLKRSKIFVVLINKEQH